MAKLEQFKMQPFVRLTGTAVALRRDNVDTDQILPARYLKVARADGLAEALFRDLRQDANGKLRPDFPLNDPDRQNASIMIARHNFGVGSCLLYTSPSPRDRTRSRMPSSA